MLEKIRMTARRKDRMYEADPKFLRNRLVVRTTCAGHWVGELHLLGMYCVEGECSGRQMGLPRKESISH